MFIITVTSCTKAHQHWLFELMWCDVICISSWPTIVHFHYGFASLKSFVVKFVLWINFELWLIRRSNILYSTKRWQWKTLVNSIEDYIHWWKYHCNLHPLQIRKHYWQKMLANEHQFQIFMMDNFTVTPYTCINACASLTWQDITISAFANSITFKYRLTWIRD